ncbi:MAG: hypothetical protein HY461_00595 [Parcubacteria group bacterium]|nr:hypothetical protein [Parcubacteria group bacterium]
MKMFLYNTGHLVSAGGATVEQTLRRLGVHVMLQAAGEPLNPSMFDAALLGAGGSDAQSTYLIALTLAKQKPVIYLLAKGRRLHPSVDHLLTDESCKNLVRIVTYTAATLEHDVARAIAAIEDKELDELPSIKFTLRITSSMERYLQWKSKQTGMSKADFLRQRIQKEIIEKDTEYRDS